MDVKRLGLVIVISAAMLSGCASYRVSSNVEPAAALSARPTEEVLITEESLPLRAYRLIGPLEVSVKKLTVFHKDPTKEQADAALREKAAGMGADAVMEVRYSSGIGLTTWGYMDAQGKAVKLVKSNEPQ